jgi:prepilin-type N-terminal cleavage/methylation domain-containing protein
MNKYNKISNKGFTLLEILLTIVVIGILSSIVLVAINPSRQISQSRNLERQVSINDIYNALQQYNAVNRGFVDLNIPTNTYIEICDTGNLTIEDTLPSTGYCDGKIDLRVLVPTYLSEIPKDTDTIVGETGYEIAKDSNNQISLRANKAELEQDLVINTITPTQTFLVQAGGSGGLDKSGGVSKLSDGSVLVTGSFEGTTILGQGEPNATTLVSAGSRDIFIAKYNPSGTLAWAKRAGGTSEDYGGNYIIGYADGTSIVTGSFTGTAVFGQGEPNATTLVSAGSRDIFVAKYATDGNLVWAKRAGGTGEREYGFGLAANSDGSALVTGYFEGTAVFGQGEANATTLVSGGATDTFIAKYNSNGTLAWSKRIGGNSWEWGYGISNNIDGTFVVAGQFASTNSVIFGEGDPNQTILTASGTYNSYIAKYNSDGSIIWAKKVLSIGADRNWARDIGMHSDGSSIVTGFFWGTAVFGQGESNETTLVSTGVQADIYVAKYNSDGTLAWAKKAGGNGGDLAIDIAINTDGSSIITGYFEGTATFGQGESNQTSLVSAGAQDAFIAKYNANGTLAWARRAGGSGEDSGRGVDVDIDGNVLVVGYFQGLSNFGQGGIIQELTSIGGTDSFIAKYNSNGTLD